MWAVFHSASRGGSFSHLVDYFLVSLKFLKGCRKVVRSHGQTWSNVSGKEDHCHTSTAAVKPRLTVFVGLSPVI